MKKIILIFITIVFVLTGCTNKENVTFDAQIEDISDNSIMVTTSDNVGFDKASVGIDKAKIDGELDVGNKVKITILPEIRESYPVQVTATKVEVIETSY